MVDVGMPSTATVAAAGVLVAGVAGCATTERSEPDDSADSERGAETTTRTPELETVRERSKRKSRERARIDVVIEEHLDELTACYLRGVSRADAERTRGRLTFRWTIDAEGRPHDVELAEDSLRSSGVSGCVEEILAKARFRSPESESVEVEYPFDFRHARRIASEEWYERVHASFRGSWEPPEQLRIEEEDDEGVKESKREALRDRARETYLLVELSDRGAITSVRELARSGDEAFRRSVDEALERFREEGDRRFPVPREDDLRELVRSTGFVLHQWMPPTEEESSTEQRVSTGRK